VTSGYARPVIGVSFITALFVAAVIMTHNTLTEPYPGHNDFLSRWEGARSFWIDGLNPYGEQASLNIQMKIYGRPVKPGEDPGYFAYPLYTALLVWPLVHTSYAWASAIWMVLLAALLIGALLLLFDLFRWRPAPWLLAVFLVWGLIFYFATRGLLLGQPGVVVYFLEVLTVWALAKGQHRLAGAALAISTIKPQMGFLIVPFLLLWGLRERRWAFILTFSGVIAALLLASFLLQPAWLGDWLAQLQLYPSYTALGSPVWIIFVYYLRLGNWAEIAVAAVLVVLMLAAWYTVLIGGRAERWLWTAVLTLTVTHLVAARTATPHYTVFIIPLVFYCAHIAGRDRRRGNGWVVLILLALAVFPWLHFLATVVSQFEHPTLYLPLPLIMLALLWWTRQLWWAQPHVIPSAKQP
jgi:hypothetical protein